MEHEAYVKKELLKYLLGIAEEYRGNLFLPDSPGIEPLAWHLTQLVVSDVTITARGQFEVNTDFIQQFQEAGILLSYETSAGELTIRIADGDCMGATSLETKYPLAFFGSIPEQKKYWRDEFAEIIIPMAKKKLPDEPIRLTYTYSDGAVYSLVVFKTSDDIKIQLGDGLWFYPSAPNSLGMRLTRHKRWAHLVNPNELVIDMSIDYNGMVVFCNPRGFKHELHKDWEIPLLHLLGELKDTLAT